MPVPARQQGGPLRPGPLATGAIRSIERYRRWGHGRSRSHCRFEPSCSTFALEAFATRAFPLALLSSAWRVVRCNPLVPAGTPDPVRRARAAPRPSGLATGSALIAVAGLVLLAFAAAAFAQGVTGGCTADVNGRDPATMTRDDPLVVREGDVVRVTGRVPPEIESVPRDQVQSTTTITVSIIEGVVGVSSSDHPGQGYTWGGPVNVDEYLEWGVGLYRVEGVATGTPGWTCSGSGYVRLDGNPLTKPAGQAAAGLTIVGGVGAVASTRSKRRPDDAAPSAEDVKQDFGKDVDAALGLKPRRPSVWERDLRGNAFVEAGCLFFLFGPLALEGGGLGAVAVAGFRSPARVWVRGHPVWGAISGLALGVGIAVLGQQYALWPLTVLTGIAFPVYAAVVCGVRARLGRAYRRRAEPPSAPASEPPPASSDSPPVPPPP